MNEEEDYVPYSEQWEKEIMKLTKPQIVAMFKQARLEIASLKENIVVLESLTN